VHTDLVQDGTVYFTNPHTLGIRASDGLYRFIRGLHGAMVVSHGLFGPADTEAWQRFAGTLHSEGTPS
jgi:hypothetical protein